MFCIETLGSLREQYPFSMNCCLSGLNYYVFKCCFRKLAYEFENAGFRVGPPYKVHGTCVDCTLSPLRPVQFNPQEMNMVFFRFLNDVLTNYRMDVLPVTTENERLERIVETVESFSGKYVSMVVILLYSFLLIFVVECI